MTHEGHVGCWDENQHQATVLHRRELHKRRTANEVVPIDASAIHCTSLYVDHFEITNAC